MFVGRKNEVVGKLDLAVEVLTTAFGLELDDIERLDGLRFLVIMMVSQTMYAFSGGVAKTARDMVVFGAVMELYVPAYRDEQHHKGHQKGADLQQPLFHGRKSTK